MNDGFKELRGFDPAIFEEAEGPVVSLYMPTRRDAKEDTEERIMLKDLTERARDTLAKTYPDDPRAYEGVIEGLAHLNEHPHDDMWLRASDSVAILATNDAQYVYHLDYKVEPVVIAGNQFYLKPLLRDMQYGAHYFLLALSYDRFAFIEGSSNRLTRVQLPQAVDGYFAETYADFDGEDSALDYYTLEGHMSPYHEFQSRNDVRKAEGEKFFRYVDKLTKEYLIHGRDWPMILVTLPEHENMFRKVSTIPNLLPEGIAKNPDQLTADELVADAKPILQEARETKMARLMEEFGDAEAHGHATVHIDDIAKATFEKRVRALFLARDKIIPGGYDIWTGTLTYGEAEGAPTGDILAGLAQGVLKQGGDVYILEPDEVPGEAGAAALYRF